MSRGGCSRLEARDQQLRFKLDSGRELVTCFRRKLDTVMVKSMYDPHGSIKTCYTIQTFGYIRLVPAPAFKLVISYGRLRPKTRLKGERFQNREETTAAYPVSYIFLEDKLCQPSEASRRNKNRVPQEFPKPRSERYAEKESKYAPHERHKDGPEQGLCGQVAREEGCLREVWTGKLS
eukprot:gene20472-biopygen6747